MLEWVPEKSLIPVEFKVVINSKGEGIPRNLREFFVQGKPTVGLLEGERYYVEVYNPNNEGVSIKLSIEGVDVYTGCAADLDMTRVNSDGSVKLVPLKPRGKAMISEWRYCTQPEDSEKVEYNCDKFTYSSCKGNWIEGAENTIAVATFTDIFAEWAFVGSSYVSCELWESLSKKISRLYESPSPAWSKIVGFSKKGLIEQKKLTITDRDRYA